MTTDCCEKCRFCRQPRMACNPGECHRRAPNYAGHGGGHWPAVNRDDWCGEFEMREDMKPCITCGNPVGTDAVMLISIRDGFPNGKQCKACCEKGNPKEPCCAQCQGPLGEGLFKHYPPGGWTGSGELICLGCAEKLTGRKLE